MKEIKKVRFKINKESVDVIVFSRGSKGGLYVSAATEIFDIDPKRAIRSDKTLRAIEGEPTVS